MKKVFFVILLILVGFLYYFRVGVKDLIFEWSKGDLPKEVAYDHLKVSPTPLPSSLPSASQPLLPTTNYLLLSGINLAVPFSSQAPYGDWSLPYEEACEETSSLLVDAFYKGTQLTPDMVSQEIFKMVDWENKKFGYYEDTTVAETALMLSEYFGYKKVEVNYDITLDDIKNEILAGRPVIVPLAGRLLGNPYYRHPGPPYHMLVVKGVTKEGDIITNDVGTKRGYNYVYNANVLYNAIHDWNNGDVVNGRKAMIVVYPN